MLENVSFILFVCSVHSILYVMCTVFYPFPSETALSGQAGTQMLSCSINKVKSFKHRLKILIEQPAVCAGGWLDVHCRKRSHGDALLRSKTCLLCGFI